MHRLRRFAVALLGVLLLPLTPLGADASCAVPLGQPRAGAAHAVTHTVTHDVARVVTADGATHKAAHVHAGAPGRDVPRHDHETVPSHHGGDISCPASAACANVGAAAQAPELAAPHALTGTGIAPLDVRGPASVVDAPEPPPPRVRRV